MYEDVECIGLLGEIPQRKAQPDSHPRQSGEQRHVVGKGSRLVALTTAFSTLQLLVMKLSSPES